VSNDPSDEFEPTLASGKTSSFSPGMLIGERYRLEQLLGRGGQGSVWRAHHLTLGVPVALKLTSLSSADENCALRLLQEARAAARLSHPAVVRVFDLGCHDGQEPFVVMELLEGMNLGRKLEKERRLSVTQALKVLLPIADALRAAHELGFVHRDVKPQNVFLAQHEGAQRSRTNREFIYPKLLDFGVVKVCDDGVRQGGITRTGIAVGSPLYLSPEQALCADVDARADVWGYCTTLYECLTGRHPFAGTTYTQVVRAIVELEPRSIMGHGVQDEALWAIIQKGLAKAREDRWTSMAELGGALANLLSSRGVNEDAAGIALSAVWPIRSGATRSKQAPSPALPPASVPSVPPVSIPIAPPAPKRVRYGLIGAVLTSALTLVSALLFVTAAPREINAEAKISPAVTALETEPVRPPEDPPSPAPQQAHPQQAPPPTVAPISTLTPTLPPRPTPLPKASSTPTPRSDPPSTHPQDRAAEVRVRNDLSLNDSASSPAACEKGEAELLDPY
jgi:serine/threonine protein kinase